MKSTNEIFKNSPFGYALHKIILDEKGKPVDYKFLEVNKTFEKLTGLKQADIIGKNVTEAIPGIEKDKFDWIAFYGKIALEQKEETFEQYSEQLGKHYKVQVYAPQKEYFVTIFTDITAEKSIAQIAAKFNTFDSENIDLQYIADKARELSGAKYAVLNKFDKNGRDFSSIAISGANKHIEKAVSSLGFDIVGKKWEYNAERQKIIDKQKTTIFEKLTDLSGSVIPQKTTDLLCKTFNIGEAALVKITRNNIMLADFTLIFERGKHLENKEIVETFADLTGMLLSRIDERKKSEEKLIALNQQLEANNQQLTATEQQLRASNQQLEANIQQLTATEQQLRATEQQLRATNQQLIAQNKELLKLSTAIKQSPSVIAITDIKGNLEFVNPKFTELTGYTFDEVVNKNPRILKSGYTTKEEYKNLWKTISSGKEWQGEFQNKKKNGELYWERASISPIFDEHGKIINYIKVAKDITEQKLSLQALKENEEKFRTLFNHISDAVFIFDPETFKIIDANEATSRIYGYSSEELKGMSVLEFSAEVEKSKSAGKTINQKGEIKVDIRRHKKKDGTDLYVELQGYKMIINNKPIAFVVCHDITERIKYEKELRAAMEKAQESDRLKSAFLANMSHEIRTPMNAILGFAELLKDPGLTGEERKYYFEMIEGAEKRMLDTINDIIDISKIEAGQVDIEKSEASVNEILKEHFRLFHPEAQKQGLELIYEPTLSDKEATIITDKHKLEGILTNLIKNAIKFTKHGKVSFGYSLTKRGDIKELEFYVKDTGIGIPSDRIHAIFNRFEKADIEDTKVFEGSGLGLAISKSYVEMLGGRISVTSEEGKGSTFIFTIPYEKPSTKEPNTDTNVDENKIHQAQLNNLSVIIAEDDESNSLVLQAMFKNTFKKIIWAKTGRETIAKLRENPETDMILMDIKMPEMNGYEATREIRKFNQDVIIIAQTAFALVGDKEKALEAGCDDYIPKPINKKLLLEKISTLFDKKRSQPIV